MDRKSADGGIDICQGTVATRYLAACEDTLAIVCGIWRESGLMLEVP